MRALKLSVALAAILALAVPMALGADLTRDEYVAKVEPICKANAQANEKILKGVREKVKQGKLKVAGAQFAAAAKALKKTLVQLEAVPQPSNDGATLRRWLGYVETEADLFQKVADKLKAENKVAAQAMVLRLTHTANLANSQVLSFEFTHCKFDPSRVG
jgi:hypothetical protein